MQSKQAMNPSDLSALYTRLTPDTGLLTLDLSTGPRDGTGVTSTPASKLHVVFILDRSGSMGDTFHTIVLPACADYLQTVGPRTASAVFFNEAVEVYTNVTADSMRSLGMRAAGTTRIDRGVAAAVRLVLEHATSDKDGETVLQFIFMSDGANDPACRDAALERAIRDSGAHLVRAKCASFVSVINMGASADTRAGMWAHSALSTMDVPSDGAFAVAHAPSDVPQVVSTLSSHTLSVVGTSGGRAHEVCMPPGSSIVTLVGQDTGSTDPREPVRVVGDTVQLLIKGDRAPSEVSIDGEAFAIVEQTGLTVESGGAVLSIVDDHARRVAMAQVRGDRSLDSAVAVAVMTSLLDVVEQSGVVNPHTVAMAAIAAHTPRERVRLMRRSVAESRARVGAIRNSDLVSKAAQSDMAAYIADMGAAKYGAAALRRAQASGTAQPSAQAAMAYLDAISLRAPAARDATLDIGHGNINDDDDEPKSFISHATAGELWAQALDPAERAAVRAVARGLPTEHDVLYAFGMLGYGIATHRPPAAIVEPWKLVVTYVSCDLLSTSDALCALDGAYRLEDMSRRVVTDVAVVRDPANPGPYDAYARSPLWPAYLAVVHARNPSVAIASQRTALLGLTMLRAATQMASGSRDLMTEAHARVLLRLVLHVARLVAANEDARSLVANLCARADPGSLLTTKAGIKCLAQALTYLVCVERAPSAVVTPATTTKGSDAVARAVLAQAIADAHHHAPLDSAHLALSDGDALTLEGDQDGKVLGDTTARSEGTAEGETDAAAVPPKTVDALEAMLAIVGHPVPTDDDQCEPTDLVFDGAFDTDVAARSGLAYLQGLRRRAPVVNALAATSLAAAVHGRLLSMGHVSAGPHVGPFASLEAHVASSPDAEVAVARVLSDAMNDPCGRDPLLFVARHWGLDTCDDTRDRLEHNVGICGAALAAQAARRPRASDRCPHPDTNAAQLEDLSTLEACVAYLSDTAAFVRRERYRALVRAKNARLREIERLRVEAERLAKRREDNRLWRLSHVGVPDVFGAKEIADHNAAHPDDQWVPARHNITGKPSGLLAKRCCFRSCPLYLQYLPGLGLWQHLEAGGCVPGYHVTCLNVFNAMATAGALSRPRADVVAEFESRVLDALSISLSLDREAARTSVAERGSNALLSNVLDTFEQLCITNGIPIVM